MDSRADMRNVTTILLSEDSSSSTGRVDTATWAMIPECSRLQAAQGPGGAEGKRMWAARARAVAAAEQPGVETDR